MRVLTRRDLRERKGIFWSRQHLDRKIRDGEFPKPFKLSDGKRAPNVWDEREIDAWLKARRKRGENASEAAATAAA
jgi:predicted DNA-binding transcriptional regulator AlpA